MGLRSDNRDTVVATGVGALLILIATVVMLAWWTDRLPSVRLGLGGPVMRFNGAVMFVSLGSSIILLSRGRTRWARGLAAFVSVVSTATAMQYPLHADFGIDALLFRNPHLDGVMAGDRMGFNTAICTAALGMAMLIVRPLERGGWRSFVIAILASAVSAVALVAIFGHFTGLTAATRWAGTYGMSLLSGISLAICGGWLTYHVTHRAALDGLRISSWTPLVVGNMAVICTFALWHAMDYENGEQLRRRVQNRFAVIRGDLSIDLRHHEGALTRMAARWTMAGRTEEDLWTDDAKNYLAGLPGLCSIAWIDSSGEVQRIATSGPESKLRALMTGDTALHRVMLDARDTGRVEAIPRSTDTKLNSDIDLWVCFPVSREGASDGCLVAAFDFQRLLARTLRGVPVEGQMISLRDGDRVLFKNHPANADGDLAYMQTANVPFADRTWTMTDTPVREWIAKQDNGLPRIVLGAGLAVALLLTVVLQLMAWTRQSQRDAVAAAARIAKEIEDRSAAQLRQQEAERRFRDAFDHAPIGMVWTAIDGRYLRANKAFCDIVGYSESHLLEMKLRDMTHPDDTVADRELAECVLRGEVRGYRVQKRYQRADGTTAHVLVDVTYIRGTNDSEPHFFGQIQDITAQMLVEQKLKQTLALQQAILDNANHSIIAVDHDGTISVFNRAAEKMLGYTADEMVGKVNPSAFHDRNEMCDRAAELSREVGHRVEPNMEVFVTKPRSGSVDEREWTYVRKDGSRFPVLLSINALLDDVKRITGYVGIASDITERKIVENELLQAKQIAELANRAKSDFLANMSHEIRTPMNGIMGMADLTLGTPLDAEQREYIKTIKESADSLLTVINDILDFSKIEAGKMALDAIDFDLHERLASTAKVLAVRAQQKGLELIFQIDPDVPTMVVGDPDRLRQVIVNLLGNAIKFTDTGEIVLRVQRMADKTLPDGQCRLHVSVTDTGVGIPLDKQQTIFESFAQADTSTTRKYGGTGLGLTISSRLVQLMRGQIWVDSQPGKGSTFHFTVGMNVSHNRAVAENTAEMDRLQRMPVLVVDDNATNRKVLFGILGNWKMKPTLASSASEALSLARAAAQRGTPFPLILVDHMMPDMDGFSLVEAIHRDRVIPSASVMMLSSAHETGVLSRCKELGIAAYLHKPVQQAELLASMLTALHRGSPQPASMSVELSQPEVMSTTAMDKPLDVLLAEDNAINLKVVVRRLNLAGHRTTVATNGREAVAAYERQPFDIVLMDVQMPEMDGFEATATIRLKEQDTGKHVPIIAMTAHAMKGDRERCLEAGMDEYVSKPIDFNLLFRHMAQFTRQEKAKPVFDREAMLASFDQDLGFVSDLVAMLLDDSPRVIEQVRDAVERRDADALARAAHRFKSSIVPFQAPQALEATKALEALGRANEMTNVDQAYQTFLNEVQQLIAAIKPIAASGGSATPSVTTNLDDSDSRGTTPCTA